MVSLYYFRGLNIVCFCADKGHAAILTVHEQLLPERLTK